MTSLETDEGRPFVRFKGNRDGPLFFRVMLYADGYAMEKTGR